MKERRLLYIFIALISLCRILYIIYSPFDLSPDEAHYWEWSRRLDLSYYSKGPGVAYLIALTTTILGNTEIGVRIGAVVFSALTTWLFFLFTKEITGSERDALLGAIVLNVVPLFWVGSTVMTTDVLLVAFWTLSLYGLKRLIIDREDHWWHLIGLTVGLGFLCKYTMVLFYGCLLALLVATGRLKQELKTLRPYMALAITAIVSTPVLIWNLRHNFVGFRHVAGLAHVESGLTLSFSTLWEFVLSQMVVLTPLIFVATVYGMVAAFRVSRTDERGAILFWTSAPILAIFLAKSLQAKVQANWALLAYLSGLSAAIWVFSQWLRRSVLCRLLAGLSVVMALGLSVLIFFPSLLPERLESRFITTAIYKKIYGWQLLGNHIGTIKDRLQAKGIPLFILSDRYQIASELAFYVKGNPITYNLYTGGRRLNQYDLWQGFYGLKGYSAIHVRSGTVDMEPTFRASFRECRREVLPIMWKHIEVKSFSIFICHGFKGFKPPPWGAEY